MQFLVDVQADLSLLAISADAKPMILFLFSQKTGFDISCKLSPLETICMKCQILFSGKNKNNMLSADFLPRMLSIKVEIEMIVTVIL